MKMASIEQLSSAVLDAVISDDVDRVTKLLQSGADHNINRGKGDYYNPLIPLCVAAKNDQLSILDLLLNNSNINTEIADCNGWTALHFAAFKGNYYAVKLLISRGTDVNKRALRSVPLWHIIGVNCAGSTPLHFASYNGDIKCVQILLEHGADATVRNGDGQTARDVAVSWSKTDVVHLIDRFDFYVTRVSGQQATYSLQAESFSVREEPVNLKETVKEIDSLKAENISLKAEVSSMKAELARMKADLGRVSFLETDVTRLKADVDNNLSCLKTLKDHITNVPHELTDLYAYVEEIFPQVVGPSLEDQLETISRREDVEQKWWSIGIKLGFTSREMWDFTARTETMLLAINRMLKAWCDRNTDKSDDEKMNQIWNVLEKVALEKDE